VVKGKILGRAVDDVGHVGNGALLGRLCIMQVRHLQPERSPQFGHRLGIAFGQIGVGRHHMGGHACHGGHGGGSGHGQGLAFTRGHLCEAVVQHEGGGQELRL